MSEGYVDDRSYSWDKCLTWAVQEDSRLESSFVSEQIWGATCFETTIIREAWSKLKEIIAYSVRYE